MVIVSCAPFALHFCPQKCWSRQISDITCVLRTETVTNRCNVNRQINVSILSTRGKVLSWEYRSPRKRNSSPPASVILCWVSWVENVLLIYYASSDMFVCLNWKLFVYIGKNPRFTAFLDSNLHTRLAIVTENELGLAFPPRNLPKKFRPDPSTFYLTNKQTDRQTNQRRWFHNPSLSRG